MDVTEDVSHAATPLPVKVFDPLTKFVMSRTFETSQPPMSPSALPAAIGNESTVSAEVSQAATFAHGVLLQELEMHAATSVAKLVSLTTQGDIENCLYVILCNFLYTWQNYITQLVPDK